MTDVNITLGGEQFRMRPSYGAMRDIEDRTSLTLGEIYELALAQRLRVQEIATLVWIACQAAGESLDDVESVGKSVFEMRVSNDGLRRSLARYCLACLYQPADAKKKFEAEVEPLMMLPQKPTGSM